MRILLLFPFLLPFLLHCKTEESEHCNPIPGDTIATEKQPVVLWQTPLNPDTMECYSMRPIVYHDKVLYSMLFYRDGYELLRAVDAQTGAPGWNWDPLGYGETLKGSRQVWNNLLILTHGDFYYGIDMNTGQNQWVQHIGSAETTGDFYLSVINDQVYTEQSSKYILDTLSYMTRAAVNTGKWDTLFQIKGEGGYRPHLFPPALWINPNGDSILILQNRQWNFDLSDGRVDIMAYNLKSRQFEWKVSDFDPVGNSSVENLLVYDNKAYILCEKTMYCFNAATGDILWKWPVPQSYDNLMLTNMLLAEGKIFVKPANEEQLYGLDPNTGIVLKNFISGSGPAIMTYYQGVIYYGSGGDGRMYAYRADTGEKIWDFRSPHYYQPGRAYGKAVFDDMVLAPEYNCIFITDRFYVMAIKLPE